MYFILEKKLFCAGMTCEFTGAVNVCVCECVNTCVDVFYFNIYFMHYLKESEALHYLAVRTREELCVQPNLTHSLMMLDVNII